MGAGALGKQDRPARPTMTDLRGDHSLLALTEEREVVNVSNFQDIELEVAVFPPMTGTGINITCC